MRDKIIEIALAEVGTKENPPNSNIQKYGQWYAMNGVAWCAIFISWVLNKAGYSWPKIIESKKGFAYVPTLYLRALQNNWITKEPKPGDAVIFDWNDDNSGDHIGIFKKWVVEGKKFETIEGNTSKNNQSNGGQVMSRNDREIKDVQAFISLGI